MNTTYPVKLVLARNKILRHLSSPTFPEPPLHQTPVAVPCTMARHLEPWKHVLIRDMIRRKCFTTSQIAEAAECSGRSVRKIRADLALFDGEKPPVDRGGRPRGITRPMLEALCEHLTEKPGLYLDEMVIFLYDEFGILLSSSSIKRTLSSIGWSKKKTQQKAKERNLDLRDFYFHKLSEFHSYQLVSSPERHRYELLKNLRVNYANFLFHFLGLYDCPGCSSSLPGRRRWHAGRFSLHTSFVLRTNA